MSVALEPGSVVDAVHAQCDTAARRLEEVRREIRSGLALWGAVRTLAMVFLFVLTSLAADWLLRLNLPMRLSLLALAVVAIGWTAFRWLIRPLSLELNDLDLAAILDRRQPGIGQKLAALLQLPMLVDERAFASPSMVQAAVSQFARDLESADFSGLFDRARRRRQTIGLAGMLALVIGFAVLAPATAELWARRWLLGSDDRWPQRTYLSLVGLGDGDRLLVPRGESFLVQVDSEPELLHGSNGWLVAGRGSPLAVPGDERPVSIIPERVSVRYTSADGSTKLGNFTHFEGSRFRYELPPVVEPLELSVVGGDDWFGPVLIEPIDRPGVAKLQVIARRPGRSDVKTYSHESSDTQLLFLPRTELELLLTSNVSLVKAELACKTGKAPILEKLDDRGYRARWTMQEAQTLEIQMISERGRLASKPYFLSIGLLDDREPRLAIRSSGVGRRVTPNSRVPLVVQAQDDFGLTSLAVELERTQTKDERPDMKTESVAIALPSSADIAPITDFEAKPTVSLMDFAFASGMLLKLRAVGQDNCDLGSQSGASRAISLQIVTPEELFYEILMRQRAERAKFAAALTMAKSQLETLDLPPTPESASNVIRKHQVIARQVWQVANRLDATLTEMTLNDLGSAQARELLKTNVIEALERLHDEPLAEQRARLDSLASRLDDAVASQSRQAQQEINTAMQRILDQMSQWESLVDVLNQVRAIIKLQQGVFESTEQQRKKKNQSLFDD
jgi:hypothetical protein